MKIKPRNENQKKKKIVNQTNERMANDEHALNQSMICTHTHIIIKDTGSLFSADDVYIIFFG